MRNKKPAKDTIPLIHNYCDKWCGRCGFVTRCAVGLMYLQDKRDGTADLSPDSPEFWKKLNGTLADTFQMVREWAKKNGVDVDAPIPDEYWEEEERKKKSAEAHVCAKAGRRYMDMVRRWMDGSSKDFERKADELMQDVEMDLPGRDPRQEALEIKDAVDVILWNHTVIRVKLMRALHGIFEEHLIEFDDIPRDYDGSAKVAMVCIDNSVKAWEVLLRYFPEKEDEILKMLSVLQKLRRRTELEFPDAWAFKRPGFDEES